MELNKLLQYLRQAELPGICAHKEMSFTERNFEKPSNCVCSAVNIILLEEKKEIVFPLIKRTQNSYHHKGQIALPGGRLEKNESIEECAIRESEEEIGILRQYLTPVKQLTELYIPVSNYMVFPLISYCEVNTALSFNTTEVEKILLCSVSDLVKFEKETARVELNNNLTINAPCFKFQGEIIWGATALILNEFRHILMKGLS